MKICKNGRIWGRIDTDYHNPEYIRKQREAKLGSKNPMWGKRGKKNPNWKGGVTKPKLYIKKGWNPKSGAETRFKKGHLPTASCFKKGDKHPNWKGGVSSLTRWIKLLPEYKEWRHKIFVRDNYTCVKCHQVGKRLNAHHIKAQNRILKENHIATFWEAQLCKELWDVNNGITLCEECHKLTDNYGIKEVKSCHQ